MGWEELAIRQAVKGRELFQSPGYRFHAVVTTLASPPEEVWRTYNGRADSENRIKELKSAFGADGFCFRRFCGTRAPPFGSSAFSATWSGSSSGAWAT